MKRFLIIISLLFLSMPVFAVCAIEAGMCKAGVRDFESLNERLIPNKLDELKEPSSLPTIEPPSDLRYNLEEPQTNAGAVNDEPYNSNCQFDTCLGEPE